MATTATEKFNFPRRTAYLELPRAFFGKTKSGEAESPFKGLNSYARFFLALVHTSNKIEGQPAKLTYEDIIAVLGGSHETVKRYKQLLIDREIIKEIERSHYKIIAEYAPTPFDKVKSCLFKEVVEMHEDENAQCKRHYKTYRKLSKKAVMILTFVESMENNGEFTSSQARLGVALDMPRTTAGDGVRESVYARLLICSAPTEPQKISAGLTKYEVDAELRAVKFKEAKPIESDKANEKPKRRDNKKQSNKDEEPQRELQVQIERHFFDLRHEVEAGAEEIHARAVSDNIYGGIEKQLKALAIKIAFERDERTLHELETEKNVLEIKGDKRLRELGIKKADFKPRYKCKICNDTGYDSGGAPCECLKRFIKTVTNN